MYVFYVYCIIIISYDTYLVNELDIDICVYTAGRCLNDLFCSFLTALI